MIPPACQHLRTKNMFIPALAAAEFTPQSEEPSTCSPCYYWCNRTLTEIGPDDQGVDPQLCQAQRGCFEA